MPLDASVVDLEDAALARMARGEVAQAQAGAALYAEGVEGLLPAGVGRVVGGEVPLCEDAVLEIISLLDYRAEFLLLRLLAHEYRSGGEY